MQFVNMNLTQFKDMVKRGNKFHAKKTVVDGINFDSKKESRRYMELKAMESMGIISDLQRQVPFVLQESFVNNQGKKIRAICYYADFVYTKDGKAIVEDCKGGKATITPEFRLKLKLFQHKYPGYYFQFS